MINLWGYIHNKATISIAHNLVQYDKRKHIRIDQCFIKEKLNERIICILFIKSDEQLPDKSTEGMSNKVFNYIIFEFGRTNLYVLKY